MQINRHWQPGEPCPNNQAVICPDTSKCSKCGWNPKVARERAQAVEKKLNQQQKRGATRG